MRNVHSASVECVCVFQMKSVVTNTSTVTWWFRRVSACTTTIRRRVARPARVWRRGAPDTGDRDHDRNTDWPFVASSLWTGDDVELQLIQTERQWRTFPSDQVQRVRHEISMYSVRHVWTLERRTRRENITALTNTSVHFCSHCMDLLWIQCCSDWTECVWTEQNRSLRRAALCERVRFTVKPDPVPQIWNAAVRYAFFGLLLSGKLSLMNFRGRNTKMDNDSCWQN